jgi:hypothetical protein
VAAAAVAAAAAGVTASSLIVAATATARLQQSSPSCGMTEGALNSRMTDAATAVIKTTCLSAMTAPCSHIINA